MRYPRRFLILALFLAAVPAPGQMVEVSLESRTDEARLIVDAIKQARMKGFAKRTDVEESRKAYLGVDREYYRPVDRGFEKELAERLTTIRRRLREARGEKPDGG